MKCDIILGNGRIVFMVFKSVCLVSVIGEIYYYVILAEYENWHIIRR